MKKQLPSHPHLEQLKKQAKSLLKGHQAAVPAILARIREYHPRWQKSSDDLIANTRFTLADAQLVLAREYGFETWSALKARVLSQQASPSMDRRPARRRSRTDQRNGRARCENRSASRCFWKE